MRAARLGQISDNNVKWDDVSLNSDMAGRPDRVLVVFLDNRDEERLVVELVERLRILNEVRALDPFSGVADPVEWQRAVRHDRDLPGRDE